MVYVDDVNVLGEINIIKENAEALVVACKEIGLEVNAEKTRYSTWLFLEISIQDKITTERWVINYLNG